MLNLHFRKKCVDFVHIAEYLQPRYQAPTSRYPGQSTTNAEGKVGQRYINHRKNGSKVLLFVREFKNDIYGNTAPYTYLGTANYVSHNGSRPMNITWKLDEPIPAKYLKKTNKLVVG